MLNAVHFVTRGRTPRKGSVVDASIIPLPPSGFPHIVTIMLAERLSTELATDRRSDGVARDDRACP